MYDPDDMINDDIPCLGDEPSDDSLEPDGPFENDEGDNFLTDGEADEDAMASAGHGCDESYGCFGGCEE